MKIYLIISLALILLLSSCAEVQPTKTRTIEIETPESSVLNGSVEQEIQDEVPIEVEETEELICKECQYEEQGQCKDYACCKDSDCDDNNAETKDNCFFPSTKKANCVNAEKDECQTDKECDDKDVMTTDVCEGTPRKCSNKKVSLTAPATIGGVLNCGSKSAKGKDVLDCFTNAAFSCEPAKATLYQRDEDNQTGVQFTYDINITPQNNDCEFHHVIKKVHFYYTSEYQQELTDSGMTFNEISNEIKEKADVLINNYEGDTKDCVFETRDLHNMIRGWEYTIECRDNKCYDWSVDIKDGDFSEGSC